MIEVNKIKEIFEGHYQVILDFPSKHDLIKILDSSYKYVWGINHIEDSIEWNKYTHTLFDNPLQDREIKARNIKMEFLISTKDFVGIIPKINQSINIIQTNVEPPYYLNLEKLEGKGRYDLLKQKIDYLFELEMPGQPDYSPLISPDITFLKKVLERVMEK